MQRPVHVVLASGVAVLAAAEWLRSGGATVWAVVAAVAGLAAVAVALRTGRGGAEVAAAAAALLVAGVVVRAAVETRAIECCWAELRERTLVADSAALEGRLAAAVADVRRLAARAARAAALERGAAFAALAAAVGGEAGPERGVALLDARGEPWAWAGRHRTVPTAAAGELHARISPFYVVLEARRQTATGGTAVGSLLLAASPAPVDVRASVAGAFAEARGVGVRVLAPAAAPRDADVFDYTIAPGDTLFSVQLVPRGQGDAKLGTLRAAGAVLLAVLGAALLGVLVAAPTGPWRWGVLVGGLWIAARSASSELLPLGAALSPTTFFRPLPGGFTASAAVLAATGFVALIGAWHWWHRGVARRAWGIAGAALLLVAAPYLVRYLGRGISPPASGAGFGLWLSWQAAIATAAMALVAWAAALVRGTREPARPPITLPLSALWAVGVALLGLWVWQPSGAWPDWYTYLWLPALVGAVVPAPRRWALAGVALVAGSAAALVTWGAALEGRVGLASRDLRRLGDEGDPVVVALLERLGQQAARATPPSGAGELYRFWTESPLAARAYPAVLGLWDSAGLLRAQVRLAPLDLPPALLSALARPPVGDGPEGPRIERLQRIPGVHYVLLAPLASGDRLVVGVGPSTRLLAPDRVARFLRGEPRADPPYEILLSLPDHPGPGRPGLVWARAGWSARGERRVELLGGPRHVHVRIDLRDPWALAVRGALVVLLNLALATLAWFAGRVVAEGWRPRPPRLLTALRTSYRSRLTASLMAFFGIPLLAFALWSFARLNDEARRAGDLLVQQALRDAALAAGDASFADRGDSEGDILALGRTLDTDLWVYRGARLTGTTAPVLDELGLVDALLDPAVFGPIAFADELELTVDGRAAGRSLRVGYRLVRPGPPDALTVLAAPQLLDDQRVRRQQQDLALSLMLGTVGGIAAALYLAARVARGLDRPVAALREAAVAVGRGQAPPPFPGPVPAEFTTVVSAFERMARDVRRSQAAIEEARERMARVLGNVATGVIAVDRGMRVTLANPRAAELLGAALEPGDELPRVAGAEWAPVWEAVAGFVAAPPAEIAEHEFDVRGRRIRLQLAPLGPDPDGCVVALDDTTELSRAARVLAWGEMAQQVAHEIKNPLTPIRLGVQHLRRARGGKGDFDRTLEETSTRILAEIDRLDAIARAFSRFGAPGIEQVPLEPVDLLETAREVAQLYALGHEAEAGVPRFEVRGERGVRVLARRDEVKEVLVNLFENARQAGARTVTVRIEGDGTALAVEDDGSGIAPDVMPRVFEPAFSTRSSGSGLGLAIARRLVGSWGGAIGLTSEPGRGTRVWARLRPADGGTGEGG